MRKAFLAAATLACGFTSATPASAQSASVQAQIRQSIASYPGSCPCPYSTDRGGRRCGGRSAWSRGGGYAPICFASDIRGGAGRIRRR